MSNISSQAGLFDRVIDDQALVGRLEKAIETIATTKLQVKAAGKAKREMKRCLPDIDLKDGERVRVGRFVIEGRQRGGGGIEVPQWSKVVAYRITALD